MKELFTDADSQVVRAHAIRKSRYGRRTWCLWRDAMGAVYTAPLTPETIKAALLAVGVKGRFVYYSGSATSYAVSWPMAIIMLCNARRGYLL